MEDKYYTPDISDLFVGYIAEIQDSNTEEWKKYTAGEKDVLRLTTNTIIGKDIRTKYLSKEDIESLGWELSKASITGNDADFFEIKDSYWTYELSQFHVSKLPQIRIKRKSEERCEVNGKFVVCKTYGDDLYKGNCLSINELKKIMKWLEIK